MLPFYLILLLLLPRSLLGTFHEATAGEAFAEEAIQRMIQVRAHIGQAMVLVGIALQIIVINSK